MSGTRAWNYAKSSSVCQFLPQQKEEGAQKAAGSLVIREPGTIKGLENKKRKNIHPTDEASREPQLS